jgi:hypothetical protein
MNKPTCRGCGAEIKWIKVLETQKNHPVDPDLINVGDDYVLSSLKVLTKGGVFGLIGRVTEGYVSHFDTCPKAGDFRPAKVKPQEPSPVKKLEDEKEFRNKDNEVQALQPYFLVIELISATKSALVEKYINLDKANYALIKKRNEYPERHFVLSCGCIQSGTSKLLRFSDL